MLPKSGSLSQRCLESLRQSSGGFALQTQSLWYLCLFPFKGPHSSTPDGLWAFYGVKSGSSCQSPLQVLARLCWSRVREGTSAPGLEMLKAPIGETLFTHTPLASCLKPSEQRLWSSSWDMQLTSFWTLGPSALILGKKLLWASFSRNGNDIYLKELL